MSTTAPRRNHCFVVARKTPAIVRIGLKLLQSTMNLCVIVPLQGNNVTFSKLTSELHYYYYFVLRASNFLRFRSLCLFIFLRRRFNVLMFQMASSRLDQALEIILHGDGVERLADVQDTRSKPKVRPGRYRCQSFLRNRI